MRLYLSFFFSSTVQDVLYSYNGAGLRSILVGLSNKLDSELVGRKPVKRSHGQVVGTAIMDGKLLCKIVQ